MRSYSASGICGNTGRIAMNTGTPMRLRLAIVSMRSDGRIDLTKVAAKWNGGGHPQASGCTITNTTPADAEAAVIDEIKRALRGVGR